MTRVVLAVDGNSLLHRSFHAQAKTGLHDASGRPMWAVRGLLSQLAAAVERIGPDAVIVGFDDPHNSIRRTTWPHYKAARTEKLPTLVQQLERAVEVLTELGVAVVTPAGLEADDVLASVAVLAPTLQAETVIVTSDRDSFALIDEHTRVLRILNGGVDASPLLDASRLELMLGIRPDQYRDFAALRGDPSDNLPGVYGIGPKTAARLLAVMQSATHAFDDVHSGGGRVAAEVGTSVAQRLAHADAHPTWQRNCEIMRMRIDVDVAFSPTAGPGRLPLSTDRVRLIWGQHQLSATLFGALRALCHHEPDRPDRHGQEPDGPEPASERMATPSRMVAWPPYRSGGGDGGGRAAWPAAGGRHPRRPAPTPARIDQLTLF